MSVIENFAALPVNEQRSFAASLVNKINSENLFSNDVKFEITSVGADDLTGGLVVEVSHTSPIEVSRKATWTCDTEDDAEDDPGFEANYENNVYEDVRKAFKTLATEIDGYHITLEIADVDELDEDATVEADHISHEDSGIGSYEYWGDEGYDSQPYVEVEGTIVRAYECSLAFFVDPVETATEPAIEED